jgi:hypothetical protein
MASGASLRWFWGWSDGGAGVFPMDSTIPDSNGNGVEDPEDENYCFGLVGWGLNPTDLRPDGEDPTVLDDTKARDWLAAATMKFSTTRDGVFIAMHNYNRFSAWETLPDGRELCTQLEVPTPGWSNDAESVWSDSTFQQAYPFPVLTLGSTGLPDPAVPGGFVTHVAGSTALADPEWDDCTWPDTFEPDLAPIEDTPADFGGRSSTLGQTWRFGAHPELDLRMTLTTNQARGFCPEGE